MWRSGNAGCFAIILSLSPRRADPVEAGQADNDDAVRQAQARVPGERADLLLPPRPVLTWRPFPSPQRCARDCPDATFLQLKGDASDEAKALCEKLGIDVLPTVQFYRDGQLLWQHKVIDSARTKLRLPTMAAC